MGSTGMLVREWKKVSSVKHAKIWPRLKRITRKLALRRLRAKERKRVMVTSSKQASLAMSTPETIAVFTEPMAISMQFPVQVAWAICEAASGWLQFVFLRLMYHYG